MATFKQQNVEDFYEIGEVLGRWVSFQAIKSSVDRSSSRIPLSICFNMSQSVIQLFSGRPWALSERRSPTAGRLVLGWVAAREQVACESGR